MDSLKFPRTYHFPWSPGTSSDDRLFSDVDIHEMFDGREVVVTAKLDGENTTLLRGLGNYHARSLDSRQHPSRVMVAKLHAAIQHEIPDGWRLCGENVYAAHSINYDRLTDFFYLFTIWDHHNVALPWEEMVAYAEMLRLSVVPVLYRGAYDGAAVRACWTGVDPMGHAQEGYVCRTAAGFPYPQKDKEHEMPVFRTVAKYVRKGHVQTSELWRKHWVPNKLAEGVKLWYLSNCSRH